MPDTQEGKVTMAVLSNQLKNIEGLLKRHIDRADSLHEDYEARLRRLESSSIKYEEQLKLQTGVLGTLTVLGSTIAAYLGVRF